MNSRTISSSFIDDILVFSKSKEVTLLQHEGILMDPAKVELITEWPRPTSVTRWIQLHWMLFSKRVLGVTPMQHGKVIAYASRQLKPYEREIEYETETLVGVTNGYTPHSVPSGKANVVYVRVGSGMIAGNQAAQKMKLRNQGNHSEIDQQTEFSVEDDCILNDRRSCQNRDPRCYVSVSGKVTESCEPGLKFEYILSSLDRRQLELTIQTLRKRICYFHEHLEWAGNGMTKYAPMEFAYNNELACEHLNALLSRCCNGRKCRAP
ncbi:hypothetical protein Tco_1036912 [Tanacetum coccineum]